MAETVLGNALEFFTKLGIYDVVLPFLLVFTIVYAILERTRVLGTEKVGGTDHPKRNLNAMAAFVISFLVIASSKLVEVVTQVSSQVVILLLLGVFFLMLIGSFYKEGEIGKEGITGWSRNIFVAIMLIGIVAIFLNALKTASGQTWLDAALSYISRSWGSTAFASLVLVVLVIAFIVYLTKSETQEKKSTGGGST